MPVIALGQLDHPIELAILPSGPHDVGVIFARHPDSFKPICALSVADAWTNASLWSPRYLFSCRRDRWRNLDLQWRQLTRAKDRRNLSRDRFRRYW